MANSDSENESLEGDLNDDSNTRGQKRSSGKDGREAAANWGKAKYDYYFTDYVDKDYPSSLSRKEERLASIEQDEALRIQRKLFSNLDDINLLPVIDFDDEEDENEESSGQKAASSSTSDKQDVLQFLENRNKSILETTKSKSADKKSATNKKSVKFDLEQMGSDECEFDSDDDEDDEDDNDDEDVSSDGEEEEDDRSNNKQVDERQRRPINMAIKKNRGLTPYKKKEYRNPRVKHKLKYKKAMTKRRKLVKEAQTEFYRYSGETTGIKTSTVKSIKLC